MWWIVVTLIVLGIILMLVEMLLVPGVGVAGFLSLGSLVAACWYAFADISTAAGWWTLLAAVVVLAVLLFFALLLFRRRRMETAGDVVAVNVLKPVFKYCFAFGGALVLGSALYFFIRSQTGYSFITDGRLAVLLALMLLLLRYFGSSVLIMNCPKNSTQVVMNSAVKL